MLRRIIYTSVSLLSFTALACNQSKPTGANKSNDEPTAVEVGAWLPAAEYANNPQPDTLRAVPVTVPLAHVVILHKIDLPSKVDGNVRWLGVETTRAEATQLKLEPRDLFENPRDKKMYRRLKPGDMVKRDQVIGLLDDDQAFVESTGAKARFEAGSEEAKAYRGTAAILRGIADKYRDRATNVLAETEIAQAVAQALRYEADAVGKDGAAKTAKADIDKADLILSRHTLRSVMDGQVQQILRQPGEGVKATDPIMVIYNFEKLQAQGNLPKEHLDNVRPGDTVVIEGPRDVPAGLTFEQHTTNKPVTAITVGTRAGKSIVVSGGEDGWIYAWTGDLKVVGSWKQRSAVRALAVTRPAVENGLLLAGSDDGVARIYDLTNAAVNSPALRELDGKHEGGVTAASFSADGSLCVTADERGIYLWDVANGKKKYTFPREHHSVITESQLHASRACRFRRT